MNKNIMLMARENILKYLEKQEKEGFYIDCNIISKNETRIIVDKVNVNISNDSDSGLKFRLYDGEKFLEYGTNIYDKEDIEKQVNLLIKEAKNNKNKNKELMIDTSLVKKDFLNNSFDKNVNVNKIIETLNKIKDEFSGIDKDIVNVRTIFLEQKESQVFLNKYKNLYQEIPVLLTAVMIFVKCEDNLVRTAYMSFVDSDLNVLEKLKQNKDKLVKKIAQLKKAKKLEGGKYKVVLSPKLAGLLAHESFGHGMEADTMLRGRALAVNWIGKKIGSDKINIIDYPAIKGKNGEFYFDSDGNLAKETYLVKNGVINQPMSDIYSKTYLNLKDSSNSRIESFDHKHYTRMSNTFFQPGSAEIEELISQVEDGIYIIDSSGGMEDPKGWGVQIQGNFGQRILNGKLVDEYYDGFALTGFLPDIISNVVDLSKEIEIEGGGRCGKGHKEWVRVSEGGPHILINEVILG